MSLPAVSPELIRRLHREAPLTDVHAHPSFPAFLYRRNLSRHYGSRGAFNPLASRTALPMLSRGGVGVVWSALHVPECELFRDCWWLKLATALLVRRPGRLTTGSPFARLLEMLETVERQAARWPARVGVARSVADIERLRAAGRIAVVHTVEGAHVLEGRLERLDALAERGVAMLTLAHFYDNDIATPVDAVPKDLFIRRLCTFRFPTAGRPGRPPLTELGRELLRRMAALRIIPDVTHCSPEARREIYRAVGRDRPVVASHVGVAALVPDPYNLSDEDLRGIAATGGAAGVILMPYWLSPDGAKEAVPAIWRTMEHVREVTGSWDHVMVGSDFDGFSVPPRDVRDASRLGLVTRALLERGVAQGDVKKVLGGNAMRILHDGWR